MLYFCSRVFITSTLFHTDWNNFQDDIPCYGLSLNVKSKHQQNNLLFSKGSYNCIQCKTVHVQLYCILNVKTCISENVPSLAVKKNKKKTTYYLSVYHPRSKKLFTVIQQLQTLLCNFYPTTRGWNFHKVASIQRQYSLLVGMLRTYISTQSLSQAWHHVFLPFYLPFALTIIHRIRRMGRPGSIYHVS